MTRFEKIVTNAKNHKVIAILLVFSASVVGVAQFLGAVEKITDFFSSDSHIGSYTSKQLFPYQILLKYSGAGGVTIFDEPTRNSRQFAKILRGSQLEALESREDQHGGIWFRVRIREGWIAERSANINKELMLIPAGDQQLELNSLAIVSYPRSDGLNLRVSPDVRSEIIATFLKGSFLTIKSDAERSQERVWRLARADVGWIHGGNSFNDISKIIEKK